MNPYRDPAVPPEEKVHTLRTCAKALGLSDKGKDYLCASVPFVVSIACWCANLPLCAVCGLIVFGFIFGRLDR